MNWSHRRLLVAVAACGATFVVGRVTAAGFPSAGTELFYSGQLTNDAGAPLVTSEELIVQFFDAASGGSELCATDSTEVDLAPTLGGFRLALPAECVSAVQAQGDVWAQLVVSGTRMPRQKLGAAPYAVVAREAQNAAVATTAIEATRAVSVVDGSVGTSAIADGAVTAAKTDFAEDLESGIASLDERVGSLASIIERSEVETFSVIRPSIFSEERVFAGDPLPNFEMGSISRSFIGGTYQLTITNGFSATVFADNNCTSSCPCNLGGSPISSSEIYLTIDNENTPTLLGSPFTFFPRGETTTIIQLPAGLHTVSFSGAQPSPSVGCSNPRIQRGGSLLVSAVRVGS